MSRAPELAVLNRVDVKTVLAVDLNEDYQGNVAAIVQKCCYDDDFIDGNSPLAFIILGYRSCSGCDAWQAMNADPRAKLEHCLQVLESARWFDNLAALQEWIATADTALQWYGHESRWRTFRGEVMALEHGGDRPGWID
ncbi:hypothetical protein [Nocardia sp. NPDC051570]|uniref:hypothetical protein n=1 Tax=Nocardia sp. NPDC051570 TaxID=3364324 RepID=UPI0037B77F90